MSYLTPARAQQRLRGVGTYLAPVRGPRRLRGVGLMPVFGANMPDMGQSAGPGAGAVITRIQPMPVSASPAVVAQTPAPSSSPTSDIIFNPGLNTNWRVYPVGPEPIRLPPRIVSTGSTSTTSAPATGAIVAGTPVPANYPTNQLYVNSDGSLWEYNASTNTWFSAGTPYSGGGQAPASSTPAASTTASTNPVPSGYPTSSTYTDASGNVWAYNGAAWVNYGSSSNAANQAALIANANAQAAFASGASTTLATNPVPSGYPTSSTYTDASGNVWAYNGSAWVNYGTSSNAANQAALVANANAQAAFASGASTTSPAPVSVTTSTETGYQSILDWLSESTLISGIPNWVMAAGAGLLALKLAQSKGKR